jgi:putative PIN family toxin of toxin-antitoxin system
LAEVKEKLVDKFKYTAQTAEEAVELFRSRMEIATPAKLASPVSRDPDDDNIPGTGIAGKCSCIITGDKDLLVLRCFADITILDPSEFSDREGKW